MAGHQEWNESLFGCFDDWEICFCGWCCAPCLFGQNSERIDNSNCCLMCCAYTLLAHCYLCWVPHCSKREALRQKYGLPEDPNCSDCTATCCCSPCALCQEARFLEHAGRQQGAVEGGILTDARSIRVQPHDYHET